VKLGKTQLEVSEIGIGAWSWGDRSNYWAGWTKEGSQAAYDASMDAGITFLDTAEVRDVSRFISYHPPSLEIISETPSTYQFSDTGLRLWPFRRIRR